MPESERSRAKGASRLTARTKLNRETDIKALRQEFGELVKRAPYHYDLGKWFKIGQWAILKNLLEGKSIPPAYVEIHPSDECNFNCRWCRGGLRRSPGAGKYPHLMTREMLLSSIDDSYSLNPKVLVRFSGFTGEPLKNPATIYALRRASELGMHWGLTTNGVLLTPEICEAALKADFVNISLDAGNRETYNKLKGLPAGSEVFDRVLSNASYFIKLKREKRSKVKIGISILLQPENWREIAGLSLRLKEMGIDILQLKIAHLDQEGAMGQEEVAEMYKYLDSIHERDNDDNYAIHIMQEEDEAADKLKGHYAEPSAKRCYSALIQATVGADGTVHTCCHYGYGDLGIQGDLKQYSFREIWTGDMRSEVTRRNPAGRCRYCAPMDAKFNRLISLLKEAQKIDPDFLDWVEKTYVLNNERVHTANFQGAVKFVQSQHKTQPLIFALGTSWIRGYERSEDGKTFRYLQGEDLNKLIIKLKSYCESKGIPFIVDDDDKLLARINAERGKKGMAGAKVIALAGKEMVGKDEFAPLRDDEKNAFVVGVDSEELTPDSYIRLMEMMTLVLKLSEGLEIDKDSTPITITKDDKLHFYILVPPAEPMNYDKLQPIYGAQIKQFA